MYQTTPEDTGIREYLSPVQEIIEVLRDLFPSSSFPEIVMLRSTSELATRQQCHIDSKEFYLSKETVRSFQDISFSCFFGLEESTYLGLAVFDPTTKQLTREMVHIMPGSMLLISGNMIHYGSMYRGPNAPYRYWELKQPILRDNFRCCAFINPRRCFANSQSQYWFADDCEPRTYPQYETDEDDERIIVNKFKLHNDSNK
jgi:hypothetical protein